MSAETPKYRNLSGIYFFLDGVKPRQTVCFEELPQKQRDEIMEKYTIDQLIRLAIMLDETFRKCVQLVLDTNGFENARTPKPLPQEETLRANPWLLKEFINLSVQSLIEIGNAFDLSTEPE